VPIAFVGASTPNNGSDATAEVLSPTGSGGIQLAFIASNGTSDFTQPSGEANWTRRAKAGTTAIHGEVWSIASTPANATFGVPLTFWSAIALRYSGVDTGATWVVAEQTDGFVGDRSISITVGAGTWTLVAGFYILGADAITSGPSGWTERARYNTADGPTLVVYDRSVSPTSSTTYTPSVDWAGAQFSGAVAVALPEAAGGGGSVALSAALGGQGNLAAALSVSGGSSVALAAALGGTGNLVAALSVTGGGGGTVPLAAALGGQGNLVALLTVATPGGWEATDVYRELADRYQPILITATGGQGYLATTLDTEPTGSSSWRFFAGPLAADGITLTEVASEAAARAAALPLPTLATGRWDLPQLVEARTVRLGWRANAGAFTLREFYAERVVEGDLIRAGSVTTRILAAGAVTTDILAAGAVTAGKISVQNLQAVSAELGVVTLGAGGGLWQGTGSFASPTTGLRIWNDSGIGRLATFNGGVVQVQFDSNGRLIAGGGNVILDASGLSLNGVVTATQTKIRWTPGFEAEIGLATGTFPGTKLLVTAPSVEMAVVPGNVSSSLPFRPAYGGVGVMVYGAVYLGGGTYIDNGGLNVGEVSGAVTGQIKAAGQIMSQAFNGRRVAMEYDAANDWGQIYALHDNIEWKRLRLGLGNGNVWLCGDGTVGVRTAPLAQQALRVLGTGGTSSDYLLALINSNGTSSLLVQGNNVHQISSAGWASISDRRTKMQIRPVSGALGRVMQWELVTYLQRAHPDGRRSLGMIAQQVRRVSPHLVQEAAEPDRRRPRQGGPLLTISYTEASMEVAAALQEHVQESRDELAAVRTELAELRDVVAALRAALAA
jgi:hypothetical protein